MSGTIGSNVSIVPIVQSGIHHDWRAAGVPAFDWEGQQDRVTTTDVWE